MREILTSCPRNCYSTCSMKAVIDNGKLVSIEPFPGNRATPEGVCIKGLSYVERVISKDRLLYPLKRAGDNGKFTEISWDEAIDTIAEKILHFKDRFGAQSILFYAGSGTKGLLNSVSMNFWRLLGGCTTTYGDLCWPAGLEAERLTFGENKHNAPWDIANSNLIIVWGKNPAETNIHQSVFIEQAAVNGAKVIVIDPRRTQSAEQACLLIQPRPGTDGALALAAANLIIKNGHTDQEFINNHVHGYSEFKEAISDFTPEKVSEITDLPVEQIHSLADYIGRIKPVSITAGFGMQRYTNSGQTMRAIISLLALTGNIGKPGAGYYFANLSSHIFDDIKDPVASFPPDKPDGKIRVSISTALLGRQILEAKDPQIKMAWIERGNPVTQNPETPTVLKAIRSLDFRVVVEQFMTDTAREADIILPAKTMFEQTDVITAYWHDYIQIKQKAFDPPGRVKPETEIYYLLAKKLGIPDKEIKDNIPEPGDEAVESFLRKKLEEFPELSLEKLKESPILSPNHEEIAYSDYRFSTPSGKIELVSEEANKRWGADRIPLFREPVESTKQESLTNKNYPLNFLTPNTKNRIHSQFNNLKMIRDVSSKPEILINPNDASSRNIKTGDKVRIFNDRGSLTIEAKLDYSIKAKSVSVTNGWWITEGGTVNFLSCARETDMGYGAAFHDNLVEVEKV